MGKASKKTAPKAEVVAPAVAEKPLKKGKREAEEVIEKEVSKKKPKKKDVGAKEASVEKVEVKTEKKKYVKKQESSTDDSSSSESEEERKVVKGKVAGAAKPVPVSAPKKKEESSDDNSSYYDTSIGFQVQPGWRVYVGGFDKNAEENEMKNALREHFSSCGEVTSIDVPRNENGLKGFAYVEFTNSDAFRSALRLDHSELNEYDLSVQDATGYALNNGRGRVPGLIRDRRPFQNAARRRLGDVGRPFGDRPGRSFRRMGDRRGRYRDRSSRSVSFHGFGDVPRRGVSFRGGHVGTGLPGPLVMTKK